MRPFEMPMPIGMTPQWPRVVTAVIDQFPSYLPALAGAANRTIAVAPARAAAHMRLAIMRVPGLLVVALVNSSIPASAQRASNALDGQSARRPSPIVRLPAATYFPAPSPLLVSPDEADA